MRRSLIIIIGAFIIAVACFYLGDSKPDNENINSSIIEDVQMPEIKPPIIIPEPIPDIDEIQPEPVEPTPEPERENKLYYFIRNDYRVDVPVEYQDYLYALLKEKGHQDRYELVLSIIYHESKWNPKLISKTNDYGLMQINQCNHSWLKETLGITDFLDPYQSIKAGVHMICIYFDKYDDEEMALVCYNMGEGGALRKGITSSEYSRGVIADMNLLTELED